MTTATSEEVKAESLTALCARDFSRDLAELRDMGNTPTTCVQPGPQDGVTVDDHA